MDSRPRLARKLIVFTPAAEEDLRMASSTMGISHSMTIREALRVYAEKLQASGRAPMVSEALRLGGQIMDVTPAEGKVNQGES